MWCVECLCFDKYSFFSQFSDAHAKIYGFSGKLQNLDISGSSVVTLPPLAKVDNFNISGMQWDGRVLLMYVNN
jgi:hypothetical protein